MGGLLRKQSDVIARRTTSLKKGDVIASEAKQPLRDCSNVKRLPRRVSPSSQ
ncbi:protein of unknown function [uncultured Woeseiaceae bacterium]|uniref:Uncharacterized protein n=1 Tax=uncultured Woeseiaceae bacterium TaxID=1983305 RepID=A0A7D9H3Z6_9GAMM|nr:protein of unknown function [uncultured Woeseiaceae bacterium]